MVFGSYYRRTDPASIPIYCVITTLGFVAVIRAYTTAAVKIILQRSSSEKASMIEVITGKGLHGRGQ
jgi:hypothetical protein